MAKRDPLALRNKYGPVCHPLNRAADWLNDRNPMDTEVYMFYKHVMGEGNNTNVNPGWFVLVAMRCADYPPLAVKEHDIIGTLMSGDQVDVCDDFTAAEVVPYGAIAIYDDNGSKNAGVLDGWGMFVADIINYNSDAGQIMTNKVRHDRIIKICFPRYSDVTRD